MLSKDAIVKTIIGDIVKEYEVFESWKELKQEDLIGHHLTVGMAIRNEFGLWTGNTPEGMHPDDYSMEIMEAVHAQIAVLDWDDAAAEVTIQAVEELDRQSDEMFEPEASDITEFESTPMSAETVEAMKQAAWRHAESGEEYEVLEITNLEASPKRRADYPITVVYRNKNTRAVWSKPIERFNASMTRGAENA